MVATEHNAFSWGLATTALVPVGVGIGVFFGCPEAIALGLALALFLLFTRLEVLLLGRSVRVQRLVPPLAEDQVVAVRLTVENLGLLPLAPFELEDHFPPQVPPRVRLGGFPGLVARQTADLVYHAFLNSTRGRYQIGPLRLRIYGPLGFASRVLVLDRPVEAVVFPRAIDVRRLVPPLAGENLWAGSLSRRLGHSELFRGIREYRPGDPLRAVHWRSSARLGQLVVREFEALRSGRALLVLDLHRYSRLGLGRKGTVEYAVRIASALAVELFRRARAVGLYAVDRSPLCFPPVRSEAGLARLRRALAEVRGVGEMELQEVLRRALPLIRGGLCIPILLRRTARVDKLVPLLRSHLRNGGRLLCVLIEAEHFVPIFREQLSLQAEARCDLAQILSAAGAEVLSVGRNLRLSPLRLGRRRA